MSQQPIIDRFMKHTKPAENGCLLWTSTLAVRGYGRFILNGKRQIASRVIYELNYGTVPKGMCVCHKCDNPTCVNIDHLFLGTPKDNMQDAQRKGRLDSHRGERHGNAVLTEQQVRWAREQYRAKLLPVRAIADKLGRPYNYMRDVIKGRRWAHVV